MRKTGFANKIMISYNVVNVGGARSSTLTLDRRNDLIKSRWKEAQLNLYFHLPSRRSSWLLNVETVWVGFPSLRKIVELYYR